jgi:hypothetical protein
MYQGNSYGSTTTILAKKNTQEFGWGINNGTIYHQVQAAFNFFYSTFLLQVFYLAINR